MNQIFETPAQNKLICTRGECFVQAAFIGCSTSAPLAAGTGDARNLLNAIHQHRALTHSLSQTDSPQSVVSVCWLKFNRVTSVIAARGLTRNVQFLYLLSGGAPNYITRSKIILIFALFLCETGGK